MSLSAQIEAAEKRRNTLRDQYTEHMNAHAGSEMDDATRAVATEYENTIDTVEKNIDVMKKAEARLMIKATPVGGEPQIPIQIPGQAPIQAPALIQGRTKSVTRAADYVYKRLAVQLVAATERSNVESVVEKRLVNDREGKEVVGMLLRAASAPATTTTTGWAAELAQTAWLDFIDTLMPQSVYPGLQAKGGKFTFGRNGSITIPARAATPSIAGSFIAQGAPIPVRQAAVTATTLTVKKMGVISTFTRETAEHSQPEIEGLVRRFMQEDTSVAVDTVLLDATAASATRPAGLKVGTTAVTPTAGGGYAALIADLKGMVGVLVAANALRAPVWIMNPAQVVSASLIVNANGEFIFRDELGAGRLLGFPVLQSTNQTLATVMLLDAADFFSATGDEPTFNVSDTATLHMEDTTPAAIGTAGSPATIAGTVRSLFQTDSIGIRMTLDINWAMVRAGTVASVTAVTW